MNPARRETFLSLAVITLTTLLTYGVLISQLGFYRDDWYLVWMAQTQNTQGMLGMFIGDRPFVGWLYVFDFWLLGISPLAWNIYALLIKLLSAFAFFWLLRSLWENRKVETTFITLLFVVYPGFYTQPNALTYKQLLLAYAAALLSLAFTVHAAKAEQMIRKAAFTFFAVLFGTVYIFIYESLIGIEVIRFILLGIIFYRANPAWKENLRAAILHIIPHFILASGFLYWRLFIFESTRNATKTENLFGHFLSAHGLISFIVEFGKDMVETSIFAWGAPLYQLWNQAIYKEIGLAFGLALAAALIVTGYYFAARDETDGSQSAREWVWLGAAVIVITSLPIVAAGRNVIFGMQWDRYTYQAAFGAALFIGGLIVLAAKGYARLIFFTLVLTSGIMTQVLSASYYRAFWDAQRDTWWQLAWRAPQIQDGATLVLSTPGLYAPAEEYEVWGPANMIYHPTESNLRLSGQIMSDKIWINLARGEHEERVVRGTINVSRNYETAIILSQPTAFSCLHILDGRRFDQVVTESADVRQIAQYSNVALIETTSAKTLHPEMTLGAEPAHDWCYFYQKMDLARQMEDWQAIDELVKQAAALELSPADVSEWLPALEAYIHLKEAKMIKRTVVMIGIDKMVQESLCANFRAEENTYYDREALVNALCVR